MPGDESETVSVAPPAASRQPRPAALELGEVVAGRYQIAARLGEGGAGVVYQALDQQARMWLALKVLQVPSWSGPQWGEGLFRELRFGRSIQHPNVCRIYDVFEAGGRLFLTMEHASRGTLRASLHQQGADRGLDNTVSDARAIIAGLAAIHRAGLVHRDLKPENILRMEDGRLVVSDFGITRALEQTVTTNRLAGTPGYLAPELMVGGETSQASDVWSLGVVLHEILTGGRPRWSGSKWLEGLPRPSPDARARALAAVCRACLRANPARRPPTARHVESLLEARLRRRPGPPWRWWLTALVAGTLAALLATRLGSPPAAPAPCGAEGRHICAQAGGRCESWPDQSEHCRWPGVTRERCGLVAPDPLSPPNQGVWIGGACLAPVADLCRSSEWQRCQRFGAVSCENYGARYCRWLSNEADCNRHTDKTCWGIWTAANQGPGAPANAVPSGQPGACVSELNNLVGTPCP